MYCPKCYRLNPDENEKCSKCGYRLKKSVHTSVKNENKMKFCSHCGNKISQDAVVCPKCGCAANTQQQDRPSFVLDMISVFVPLIGLILFCVFHGSYPRKAKSVGIAALVGVAVYIGFPILMALVLGAL